jgi:hypothetical protein
MSLTKIKTEEEKTEWLAKQPNIIVAYTHALVKPKEPDIYYPTTCHIGWKTPYNKTEENRVDAEIEAGMINYYRNSPWEYVPFYHLYLNYINLYRHGKSGDFHNPKRHTHLRLLECTVKKEDITTIGIEEEFIHSNRNIRYYPQIVTKAFAITRELEWLRPHRGSKTCV